MVPVVQENDLGLNYVLRVHDVGAARVNDRNILSLFDCNVQDHRDRHPSVLCGGDPSSIRLQLSRPPATRLSEHDLVVCQPPLLGSAVGQGWLGKQANDTRNVSLTDIQYGRKPTLAMSLLLFTVSPSVTSGVVHHSFASAGVLGRRDVVQRRRVSPLFQDPRWILRGRFAPDFHVRVFASSLLHST